MSETTWEMAQEILGDGAQYEDRALIDRVGSLPKILDRAAFLLLHETKMWEDYLISVRDEEYVRDNYIFEKPLTRPTYEQRRRDRDELLAQLPDEDIFIYVVKYEYLADLISKMDGELGVVMRDFWAKLKRLSLEDNLVANIPVGNRDTDVISWKQFKEFDDAMCARIWDKRKAG